MRYAYANCGDVGELNDSAQIALLRELAALGARVIAVVECGVSPSVALPGWQVVGKPGPSAQLVLVRRDVHVRRSGAPLSVLDRRGQRIRWRRYPWAVVDSPTGRRAVVAVHMPPRRMPVLKGPYGRRLRRLLGRLPAPWLVGGDWNEYVRNDPASLRRLRRARWSAKRIDGWAIDPRLRTESVTYGPPRRSSGHFWVLVDL